LALAAWCVLLLGSAGAQVLLPSGEAPGPLVREAFDAPYGRALIAELGKALATAADPACLQSRSIGQDQLTSRGGELLVKWGTRAMELVLTYVDTAKHAQILAAAAGPDAVAELERLKTHPEVERLILLERPLVLAGVANFVVGQFDSYVLLSRLKVPSVSPLSTGNDTLLQANPAERIEEEIEQLVAKASPELSRFLDLSDQSAKAMASSLKADLVLLAGVGTFYRGVEADLAALCVGGRP
jgi:hypothetical protein